MRPSRPRPRADDLHGIAVQGGRRYAIVLLAAATPQSGYGLAYSNRDPYRGGETLYSTRGAT